MLRLLVLLLLWLDFYTSSGQTFPLASFKETLPPKPGSNAWFRLNSAKGFSVQNVDGHLVLGAEQRATAASLHTAEGTFTGHDMGEWGGELLFEAANKTKKPIQIKQGNICFIFKFKEDIYFIEGLAHLHTNRGALYKLTGQAPAFGYTKLADFDDAPEAFAINQDTVLVAQHHGFTVLRNLQPEVVLKDTFWGSLYPNSVVSLGQNTVYLGIRGGFIQLNLSTKAFKFFQYQLL